MRSVREEPEPPSAAGGHLNIAQNMRLDSARAPRVGRVIEACAVALEKQPTTVDTTR